MGSTGKKIRRRIKRSIGKALGGDSRSPKNPKAKPTQAKSGGDTLVAGPSERASFNRADNRAAALGSGTLLTSNTGLEGDARKRRKTLLGA